MGVVVAFRQGRRRRIGGGRPATGEILLFTGVRYERHADPAAQPHAPDAEASPDAPSRRARAPRRTRQQRRA